jgi:hypothetical protein
MLGIHDRIRPMRGYQSHARQTEVAFSAGRYLGLLHGLGFSCRHLGTICSRADDICRLSRCRTLSDRR